ncbi:MAG: NAD(P)/FAD-dependent oxidoreductase [Christensenellales bacterium]|nr:NAD(P)/FAD-dependent oxidoreductase [Christensenellales bacterium]
MNKASIVVVGGGAAGMLAALFAVRAGGKVVLLERNEKLGKKVYITGKGRCNVTNAAERAIFMQHILRNPRFLFASFAELDNAGLMNLLQSLGVPLKVERGERVFPVSDHSSDIIAALRRALEHEGVTIQYQTRVRDLILEDGVCRGVVTEDGVKYPADAVILATGGLSYPSTGSTGDGYLFAEQAGHSLVKPLPSLVPIETRESWPATLMGLTLKNVRLSAFKTGGRRGKYLYSEMGELLFTHFGITGPLVLTLSAVLPEDLTGISMEIDCKPALDEQTLDARLLRDFRELSRKQISAAMDGLVPHHLGIQILRLAGISETQPIHSVTAGQRRELVRLLKAIPLNPKRLRGFEEAVVTRGGINVKEVNPSTLESKCTRGLFFAGEMLDLDGTTGGYNLQIAFSTGALAGRSAVEGWRTE